MLKTYLRRHSDGRMDSVTRGQAPREALAEYRRLLARDDLDGEPWAAVLRDDISRRTLLFSRFDRAEQCLLPADEIEFEAVFMADSADEATAAIIASRK